MSGLHWLATSEHERQKAMELARALQQKESRDELGIGSIRDGIADVLFPGTSTLHTRARYFLMIPWAYQAAATARSPKPFSQKLRDQEAALIAALRTTYALRDEEPEGLIGRSAGGALKTMPSALYWQGLYVWGIRRIPGAQAVVERAASRRSRPTRDDDGQPLDQLDSGLWHSSLPAAPHAHPVGASFDLSAEEADFLAERLRTEPRTAISLLPQFLSSSYRAADVSDVWLHPSLPSVSPALRAVIEQARRASLLLHGAAWIYNVILAAMSQQSELEDAYRAQFAAWAEEASASGAGITGWDLGELWQSVLRSGRPVPFATRHFVIRWLELVEGSDPQTLVDDPAARSLITQRERAMKGRHARTANDRALKQWGGASGTRPLDFRWGTVSWLLDDIVDGLERRNAAH